MRVVIARPANVETSFALVLNNHTNFYRLEETSSNWLVKRISAFLRFSLINQWHTYGITVYVIL